MANEQVGLEVDVKGRTAAGRDLKAISDDVGVVGRKVRGIEQDGIAAERGLRRAERAGDRLGTTLGRGVVGGARRGAGAIRGMVGAMSGLTGLLAGAGLVYGGKRVLDLATKLEALGSKSEVVFGDQLGVVQRWADNSANRMGLTTREAVGLAAGFSDLLVPMGFARDQAAKMSTDVIGLSGALAQWSGGQYKAAEVSDILAKAMLGETDGLKALGISISAADVQARLAAKGQAKLTGAALEQAEAIAVQDLIFAKSQDAQKAYADGTNKLGINTGQLGAKLRELRDRGIVAVTPKLIELSERGKVLAEEFEQGRGAGGRLRERLMEMRDGAVKLWEEFRTGTGTGGDLRGALETAGDAAVILGTAARDYVIPAISWLNDHPDALKGIVGGMVALKAATMGAATWQIALNTAQALGGFGGKAGAAGAAGRAAGAGGGFWGALGKAGKVAKVGGVVGLTAGALATIYGADPAGGTTVGKDTSGPYANMPAAPTASVPFPNLMPTIPQPTNPRPRSSTPSRSEGTDPRPQARSGDDGRPLVVQLMIGERKLTEQLVDGVHATAARK